MGRFILGIFALAIAFAAGWAITGGLHTYALKQVATAFSSPAPAAEGACAFAIAGSNTIGERLAPAVVEAYFAAEGFTVTPAAATGPEESVVRAVKGNETCTVAIRSHGSGRAFEELITGKTEIGMASRPIKETEIKALRDTGGGDFARESALAEHVIALDGIAIVAHPTNPLKQLSVDQVRDIFVAGVENWSAIGAGASPIDLYARDDKSGTFQFFHENVLRKDPRWDRKAVLKATRFESSSELVSQVAANPKGVGFVGMAYVTPAVHALPISDGGPAFEPNEANIRSETYPISRRLFLYVRPDTMRANPRVAALVAFFKSEAAYPIVEKLGYVSLSPVARPSAVAGASAEGSACTAGAPEGEVYRVATAGGERLSAVIRFLPGSNTADSLARDDLGRAADAIRAAQADGRTVSLIGHSDSEGDAAENRRLALQRANTVREALEREGLLGLQVESAGEACPVASNETDAGRRTNRRVEIWMRRR